MIFLYGLLFVVGCFCLVVFIGAPYLPTLPSQVGIAMKMLDLKPGQTLIDLGSGDGALLVAAGKQKVNAIGYEINPVLFVISWLRILPYRKYAQVRLGNFWRADWPPSDAIFVFLHTNFMKKLDRKLAEYSKVYPVRVISFTFMIPDKKMVDSDSGLYLYEYGNALQLKKKSSNIRTKYEKIK